MEKFSLVVKGRYPEAREALESRGMVVRYYRETGNSSTVVYTEASLEAIHAWYGETTLASLIPGIGYPMGSLLYFSKLAPIGELRIA